MAGNKKDIEVELKEGLLSIKSKKEEKEDTRIRRNLHKGIVKDTSQNLSQSADDVKVKGAELKDGLLKVSMEKVVQKSKNYNIK